jgi:hypothetical protein
MRETGYMGIDPELRELLEDLRTGYGGPDEAAEPEEETAESIAARRRDWELRSGYARERHPSSRSTS